MPKQTVVRCVALLLLLFAAVDLFGVDLFAPGLCDASASEGPANGSADEDDCFCCCGHIVFATPPRIERVDSHPSDRPPLAVVGTSAELKPVYHPPRF